MRLPPRCGAAALLRGVAFVVWLLGATQVSAVDHALLIGVSQYPNLAQDLQLRAPANDIRMMRDALLRRGFDPARIEVLADGVEGARLPTRAAILVALKSLAARVRAGETVVLHFSGHGSLQPAGDEPSATSQSSRDWRPVFLPRDAQGWDGRSGATVANAITDITLRSLIDAINDNGAFVFAVFDACHSAKLVRGALPGTDPSQLRVRQVTPAALGLPGEPPPDVWPVWLTRQGAMTGNIAQVRARRGRAVYFYAAQSYELAAAMPLAQSGTPEWHGLFSWHLAQALALDQPMSFRQLGQHVLSRYDRLPASSATPLFSGDGLDEPVFGTNAAPMHRQWPLERTQASLSLPAGTLAGLADGALLAIIADPLASAGDGPAKPPQGTLGFVRVAKVDAMHAQLESVAWQGWAALMPKALPSGTWARLMVNPPSFTLRVAVARSACREPCLAARALAQLQRDGVPGVDVRWVDADEIPDVQLRATELGVRMLLPGATDAGGADWGFTARPGAEAVRLEILAQEVASGLHGVARTRNLMRLAARMALQTPRKGMSVALGLRRGDTQVDTPVAVEQVTAVSPGDWLLVDGFNAGSDPLDLSAFWLGADYSIRQVYPLDTRDSPRLSSGEKLRRFALRIDPGSRGTERLLVLSTPMRTGREAADFRFLEQSPLTRLRSATDPELQALLDACFADHVRRGDADAALPGDRLGMQLFTFQVRP